MAEPLVLENPTTGVTRVGCAVAGCVPLAAPVELGPMLLPLNGADVVLVPIVLGALALTGTLWSVAVLAPTQTWTVDRDGLRATGALGRRTFVRHVDADLVREAEVLEDSDDGAPVWSVGVRTATGRLLRFPAGSSREDALTLRGRILDAVGPAPA